MNNKLYVGNLAYSVRDESLHCEAIIKLFHTFARETGCLTQGVKDDIVDCCKTVVGMVAAALPYTLILTFSAIVTWLK